MNVIEDPARILIIDDDPLNVRMLAEGLCTEFEVLISNSGGNAIKMARKHKPDLILLDIVMPDLDGYQVCSVLKREPDTSDIPVVFITGMTTPEDELTGLSAGAADYITKPYNMALVRARIQNLVELKRKRDLLARLAMLDGLTGLHNRRYFNDTASVRWASAKRYRMPLAMCLVDIDEFKAYNDTLGHGLGDECLKEVAKVLARCSRREEDIVARFGGEEFVLLWPGLDLKEALGLAEEVRQGIIKLDLPHPGSKRCEVVTASFGVASILPSPKTSLASLTEMADQALYQAKNAGRNRVMGWQSQTAER